MSDLERSIARMIGIGFGGTAVTAEAEALIRRGVRNVIFFSRNVESAQQFADLAADVKDRADNEPLCTSVDQEGGRVMRLREPFTIIPSMREVGRAGDEKLAYEIGKVLARELRAINIDQNLAPVLDVDTNAKNPVIAARSFGSDPDLVSRMGVAVTRGLQDNTVGACGKHFPGHGDTSQDSHHSLPTVPHGMDRLNKVELPPFEAAIRAGVACIMTSHVIYMPVDPKYPATMSETILGDILRKRMNFDGVLMSDDMQMKAIADHYGFDDAMIRGAKAGIDLFWICHAPELQSRGIETLIKAVERGELSRERVDQANARLDKLFGLYVKPARRGKLPDFIGCEEHKSIARRVSELAGTNVSQGEDPTEAFVNQQRT